MIVRHPYIIIYLYTCNVLPGASTSPYIFWPSFLINNTKTFEEFEFCHILIKAVISVFQKSHSEEILFLFHSQILHMYSGILIECKYMSFETWNYSKHVLLFEIIIVVRVISMVNVSSLIINMAGCPENLTLFLAFFHSSLYPIQSRTETNFLYICISKAILVNDHQNLFMAFISLSVVLLHVAISFSL